MSRTLAQEKLGEARSCEVIVIQDVVVVVIIIVVVVIVAAAAAVAVVVVAVGDADVGGCNDSKLDLEFKTVCTAR